MRALLTLQQEGPAPPLPTPAPAPASPLPMTRGEADSIHSSSRGTPTGSSQGKPSQWFSRFARSRGAGGSRLASHDSERERERRNSGDSFECVGAHEFDRQLDILDSQPSTPMAFTVVDLPMTARDPPGGLAALSSALAASQPGTPSPHEERGRKGSTPSAKERQGVLDGLFNNLTSRTFGRDRPSRSRAHPGHAPARSAATPDDLALSPLMHMKQKRSMPNLKNFAKSTSSLPHVGSMPKHDPFPPPPPPMESVPPLPCPSSHKMRVARSADFLSSMPPPVVDPASPLAHRSQSRSMTTRKESLGYPMRKAQSANPRPEMNFVFPAPKRTVSHEDETVLGPPLRPSAATAPSPALFTSSPLPLTEPHLPASPMALPWQSYSPIQQHLGGEASPQQMEVRPLLFRQLNTSYVEDSPRGRGPSKGHAHSLSGLSGLSGSSVEPSSPMTDDAELPSRSGTYGSPYSTPLSHPVRPWVKSGSGRNPSLSSPSSNLSPLGGYNYSTLLDMRFVEPSTPGSSRISSPASKAGTIPPSPSPRENVFASESLVLGSLPAVPRPVSGTSSSGASFSSAAAALGETVQKMAVGLSSSSEDSDQEEGDEGPGQLSTPKAKGSHYPRDASSIPIPKQYQLSTPVRETSLPRAAMLSPASTATAVAMATPTHTHLHPHSPSVHAYAHTHAQGQDRARGHSPLPMACDHPMPSPRLNLRSCSHAHTLSHPERPQLKEELHMRSPSCPAPAPLWPAGRLRAGAGTGIGNAPQSFDVLSAYMDDNELDPLVAAADIDQVGTAQ